MSRRSLRSRRTGGLLASLAVAIAGAVSPATSSAASPIDYVCEWPLLGPERVTVTSDVVTPSEWPIKRATARIPITMSMTGALNTWEVFNLLGGGTLQGVATDVSPSPGGTLLTTAAGAPASTNASTELAFQQYKWPLTKRAPRWTATGELPSLSAPTAGISPLRATSLWFNLRLLDTLGNPVEISPKTEQDQDVDDDPFTFEVHCHLAGPADPIKDDDGNETAARYPAQDSTLAAIDFVDGPTRPRTPAVTDIGETGAKVTFGASTVPGIAGRQIAHYEILHGATKVGEAPGHGGSTPAGVTQITTLRDLSPATKYSLRVRAVETTGKSSQLSEAVTFVTSGGPNQPPTTPIGVQATDVTETSAKLTWNASTDHDGIVTGYTVRGAGDPVPSPATSVQLTGLAPDTTYALTVLANDDEGWTSGPASISIKTLPRPEVPTRISYVCEWPLAAERTTSTIVIDVPDQWPIQRPTGQLPIVVNTTSSPPFVDVLNHFLVRTLQSVSTAGLGTPGGTFLSTEASAPANQRSSTSELAQQAYRVPFYRGVRMRSSATGHLASIDANSPGVSTVTATTLLSNVLTRDDAGHPTDAHPVFDIGNDLDGNRFTSDVRCHIGGPEDLIEDDNGNPTGRYYPTQDPTLASIEFVDGPTAPGRPTVSDITTTSARLIFGSSTVPDVAGRKVDRYEIWEGSRKLGTAPGHAATVAAGTAQSVTLTGLTSDRVHHVVVRAIEANGKQSTDSQLKAFTTAKVPAPAVQETRVIRGDAQIPSLVRGDLPLNGTLTTTRLPDSGDVTGEATFQPARVRLKTIGVLPVTADVVLVPAAGASGGLLDARARLALDGKLRLQRAYLFGAIEIAGGTTCQTKRLTPLRVEAPLDGFTLQGGGMLTGTYGVSDLTGCGHLNGLLSPIIHSTATAQLTLSNS